MMLIYRILHSIPRFMSVNEGLIAAEIPIFQALITEMFMDLCKDT